MLNLLPFVKSSGIYCSLTALRYEEDFGIGDIRGGYKFIDFLAKAGFGVWKMQPLQQMDGAKESIPYYPLSSFAIDEIYADILSLEDIDYASRQAFLDNHRSILHGNKSVQYSQIRQLKQKILQEAFMLFYENQYHKDSERKLTFDNFIARNTAWLPDFALFMSIFSAYNSQVKEWPEELLQKDANAIKVYKAKFEKDILMYMYIQWILQEQFVALTQYAHNKNVYLITEIPFYPSIFSADVWAHPNLFEVDVNLNPLAYPGSAPDLSHPYGQQWNYALYNWEKMKSNGYSWWINRLAKLSSYTDGTIIDNFDCFLQYWKITGNQGRGFTGPGVELLNMIAKQYKDEKLFMLYADNSYLSGGVGETLRKQVGFEAYFPYIQKYKDILKHTIDYQAAAQISVADTPTLKGWWKMLPEVDKKYVLEELNVPVMESDLQELKDTVRWRILEDILYQPFTLVLLPIQEILGLDVTIQGKLTEDWVYRMDISVEELLKDDDLISKFDIYASKFSTNRYFKEYRLRAIPEIYDEVQRHYTVGETITLWALVEKEHEISGITNLPVVGNMSEEIKELPFMKVAADTRGTLFRLEIIAQKPGEYVISVHAGNNSIRSLEKKLEVIIEDDKKNYKPFFSSVFKPFPKISD